MFEVVAYAQEREQSIPASPKAMPLTKTFPGWQLRFATSHATCKSIDQEYVASPHQKIAARPLASWRMCLAGGENSTSRACGLSPVALSAATSVASSESIARETTHEGASNSSQSGTSSAI